MRSPYLVPIIIVVSVLFIGAVIVAAIGGWFIFTRGNSLTEEEKLELMVYQTQLAEDNAGSQQATQTAQQATLNAQLSKGYQISQQETQSAAQSIPPTGDLTATQLALSVQITEQVQPPAQSQSEQGSDQGAAAQPPSQDFETFKKNASVLLYEDMVAYPGTKRYVESTLKLMDLNYKDDGNAIGWLKSDMLSGGPGGKGWDLIIIAAEDRNVVSGEYFEFMQQALNKGSAVILEIWYIDQVASGTISTTLTKCGVKFEMDLVGRVPFPISLMVWPSGEDNPILYEPNGWMSSTNIWDYWRYFLDDLGDLLKLTGRGDAKILVSTIAGNKKDHGVVVVCMDERLILQTFSSHSYPYEEMQLTWENYIHNALKARWNYLQGQAQ